MKLNLDGINESFLCLGFFSKFLYFLDIFYL
jgi:hypothetical protein